MRKNPLQIELGVEDDEVFILTESRTLRDRYSSNEIVLSKVKAIPEIPHSIELTIEMAANYYEVPVETIRTLIKRNREEFNDYGEIRLVKGKALEDFKTLVHDELELKQAPSIVLISRRGLLRIGMMLTDSPVAKSVRHYLINVEEVAPKQYAIWAAQREMSRMERRQLTDAIQEFYNGTMNKGIAYSVFTNLVYDILFDTNAEGMRQLYELEKADPLRDSLSTDDLRKVVRVEKTISALLLLGKGMREIKEELVKSKERLREAN